jgi:myo-inositol-1(or 4)-monophosphatase
MNSSHWFPRATELPPDLSELLSVAARATEGAMAVHRRCLGFSHTVVLKELLDIVTNVDLEAEAAVRAVVMQAFPTHVFSSEESRTADAASEYRWVIDPLDGTINYTSGIPFYSASVAVQRNGETLVGVVGSVALDEVFVGVKGHGAYGNGSLIHVSRRQDLSQSVVSVMMTSHYSSEQVEEILSRTRALSPRVRGLRLFVGQALELSYIASGRLDGHVCIKSRGYSGAAGVLILREAGGRATDIVGAEFSNSSRSIVASNGRIHDLLLMAMAE